MAIQAKEYKDISERARRLYTRVKSALAQKSTADAMVFEMLFDVLREEPGFVDGHNLLRESLLDHVGRKSSIMRKMTAMLKTGPLMVQVPIFLKKGDHAKAMEMAEKALEADPTNTTTLQAVAKVAQEAGLSDLAISTLNATVELDPKNVSALTELVQIHKSQQQYSQAIEALQKLIRINPNSIEHTTELKQLTAQATMHKDNWTGEGSYRDVLRDKKQAELLEQQGRSGGLDANSMKNVVADAEANVAKQASTANIKKLAEAYVNSKMWDQAIEQYNRILNASGSMDPAIDEAITEIMTAKFDEQINLWKDYVKANPDKQADADTNMALYEQQKQDMLFKRMLERIERYPNDSSYRFAIGEMYFYRGELDKAISEFQLSQKSPQYRIRALAFMGKCTAQKGLVEMALEQFKAALEGLEKSDPMRKDCLYDMGNAFERLGQEENALNSFRELYAIDVNFKDVSAKLEKYYKKTV